MTLTLDPQTNSESSATSTAATSTTRPMSSPTRSISSTLGEWLLRNKEAISERIEESAAKAERGEIITAGEAARRLDQNIAERILKRA